MPDIGGAGVEAEGVPEIVTEERILGLCRLVMTTVPEGFGKPWLTVPDDQMTPFAKELTIYCNNHGIDPSEYIGDWFPLVITGMPIAFGVIHRHKEHKRGEKKQTFDAGSGVQEVVGQPEQDPEKIPEARPAGAQMSMMPSDPEEKEDKL